MKKLNFFRIEIFLRIFLILALVYLIPQGGFFSAAADQKIPVRINGMGGMAYPESSAAEEVLSTDLPEMEPAISGIPEPDEYSTPKMLLHTLYKVRPGDTISDIARNLGLNQDTLISVNNIKNTRLLQIGQALKIPNQDGILHTIKKGDTLSAVAEKYKADIPVIQTVNELFSENLKA
ncbi:MAG: LysM peptidoglycan-binding domain-containing protein, partial [Treponema sp.]|nr:LysM peptidoglycan-binding domain-containing protein [Treponema sp.]